MSDKSRHGPLDCAREFQTTRWSIVLAAGDASSRDSERALETLCSAYWYPLYAYARRRGNSPEEAADLTQEFFVRLLEKEYLRQADRDRGRFRSFLLTVYKRFLINEQERMRALKRGGGRCLLSIDFSLGETRYRMEPVDEWTSEMLYERRWALSVLEAVMRDLGREYAERNRFRVFERCKECLLGEESRQDYAAIAAELGMSETAARVSVHRMRGRFRELLRVEIRHTVAEDGDVDDEILRLRSAVLRGKP